MYHSLRVVVPIEVGDHNPGRDSTPHGVETSVGSMPVSEQQLMSSIAEGSIGRHLTIAQFIVSSLIDIEVNGSQSGYNPLALTITPGIFLGSSTSAPEVNLTLFQIEIDGIGGHNGHTGRSITTFRIGNTFHHVSDRVFGEVGDIIGVLLLLGIGIGLQNHRLGGPDIGKMGLTLNSNSGDSLVVLDHLERQSEQLALHGNVLLRHI